jgi:hypothetical protein
MTLTVFVYLVFVHNLATIYVGLPGNFWFFRFFFNGGGCRFAT